jgi:hypothetical protein
LGTLNTLRADFLLADDRFLVLPLLSQGLTLNFSTDDNS